MLGGSRKGGLARPRVAWRIAPILAVVLALGPRPARAQDPDRIAELTQTLGSTSEKARLSAAVALGNLGDRRAMKPLVSALSDASPKIRVVAAAGLGKLGHKASLPSLKNAADADADESVRKAAHEAALAVAKANQLPSPWPEPAVAARPGFGKQPRVLGPTPDVYVLVSSAANEAVNGTTTGAPGKADKATGKQDADIARQTLVGECNSHPVVTTVASDARRLGLDERHIDLSVVKLDVATVGAVVEVDAEVRLAISDANGKMLSFLSGGAKLSVPKHKFDARFLPRLRREVLESAVHGMFEKLLTQLRGQRTTS